MVAGSSRSGNFADFRQELLDTDSQRLDLSFDNQSSMLALPGLAKMRLPADQ
jgi:hypothetical protein